MTSVTRSGSRLAAVATAAIVAAGLAVAAPAAAAAPSDPVPGLVGGLLGQPGTGGDGSGGGHDGSQARARSDYGHTAARDRRLRSGCHDYGYRYVVTTPTHDWTLETFLHDRTGDTIASGTYFSDSDPARDHAIFRFCRYSTHPGRFTIRAKVHWYNGSTDHKVWLEPTHFRMRRP